MQSNLRILIAEDCRAWQFLLGSYFNGVGFTTKLTDNGYDALNQFRIFKFDFVLLDINMPILNGFDAAIEMRNFERQNQRVKTPIFALTANTNFINFSKYQPQSQRVFDRILGKPIQKSALLSHFI